MHIGHLLILIDLDPVYLENEKKKFSDRRPLCSDTLQRKKVKAMEQNRTKIQIKNLQAQRQSEKSLSRRAKLLSLRKKISLLEKEVAYLELLERKAQVTSDQATLSPEREFSQSADVTEHRRFLDSQI
jgi:hypothetical protein